MGMGCDVRWCHSTLSRSLFLSLKILGGKPKRRKEKHLVFFISAFHPLSFTVTGPQAKLNELWQLLLEINHIKTEMLTRGWEIPDLACMFLNMQKNERSEEILCVADLHWHEPNCMKDNKTWEISRWWILRGNVRINMWKLSLLTQASPRQRKHQQHIATLFLMASSYWQAFFLSRAVMLEFCSRHLDGGCGSLFT